MRSCLNSKLKTKPATASHIIGVWLLSALLLNACMKAAGDDCMLNIERPCIPTEGPHMQLSDYNLYTGNLSELEPVEGLLPFDLNTPLFSDYANKQRMIYVPDGSSATYRENEVLSFPNGTVLVKHFFYDHDERNPAAGRKLVETRLLIRQRHGWIAETYVWNELQTEAILKGTGQNEEITWIDQHGIEQKVAYLIPSKNDCKSCHSQNGALIPLGPKARNLNKTYPYVSGEENQLEYWRKAGILKETPIGSEIPHVPVWDDASTGTINERARIYLDVNCGNCHHPAGFANYTSLFLHLEESRTFNLGIYKMPVAFGSGKLKYDIVPGEPDSSILLFRMEATDGELRMPELGRTLVHKEGVALIREWIENLECSNCD